MATDKLEMYARPRLKDARMVLGFSGWMDGGEVSTGAIDWLVKELGAETLAEIEPGSFYIYSFPGSMEMTALFRPATKIEDGLITSFELPTNRFYYSEENNLVLLKGKEPNFNWNDYADCIFSVASTCSVSMVYFIGSVAGAVPHTREPWLLSTVSDPALKAELEEQGIRFSNYEGPASFITLLLELAAERGLPMASLVAEIPAYIQGRNPACIEAAVRNLCGLLGLKVSLDELRAVTDDFEERVSKLVQEREDLAGLIGKLERNYDNTLFDTETGDLKDWLHERGIRWD